MGAIGQRRPAAWRSKHKAPAGTAPVGAVAPKTSREPVSGKISQAANKAEPANPVIAEPVERLLSDWTARLYFRDQLRKARARVLADNEDYHEVLFALERLGQFLGRGRKSDGLNDHQPYLAELVRRTNPKTKGDNPVAPRSRFGAVFEQLKQARNDALHTGAFVRHISANAVRVCLYLEDALSTGAKRVEQFMVQSPIVAQKWQTLSLLRIEMLAREFSYLPAYHHGKWMLLSAAKLAHYLREDRQVRSSQTLDEALKNKLSLISAKTLVERDPITKVKDTNRPYLIVRDRTSQKKGEPKVDLVGILTAFDLL